jgi:hypothetical protein
MVEASSRAAAVHAACFRTAHLAVRLFLVFSEKITVETPHQSLDGPAWR